MSFYIKNITKWPVTIFNTNLLPSAKLDLLTVITQEELKSSLLFGILYNYIIGRYVTILDPTEWVNTGLTEDEFSKLVASGIFQGFLGNDIMMNPMRFDGDGYLMISNPAALGPATMVEGTHSAGTEISTINPLLISGSNESNQSTPLKLSGNNLLVESSGTDGYSSNQVEGKLLPGETFEPHRPVVVGGVGARGHVRSFSVGFGGYQGVYIGDSTNPNLDAFSRLRTSHAISLFDNQQNFGDNALVWENKTSGGTVATHLADSSIILSNNETTSGNYAYRQTKQYFRYQPGKSQLIFLTFCMNDKTENVRKRIGIFDGYNGLFLELNGTRVNIVKRTYTSGSVVDTVIPQDSWNVDVMDGLGPSTKILDITKAQILVIDYQWLGVGRVRFGFDIDGCIYYVHQFLHANDVQQVYMATANLPVRCEIENIGVAGGTSTMNQICTAISSEGGFESDRGPQFSVNTGATLVGVTTRRPILSIRANTVGPNSVRNIGSIIPTAFDFTASSNTALFEIVLNGSLTNANFSSFDSTYSIAQYDRAATTISNGLVLDSGYIAASNQSRTSVAKELFQTLVLSYSGLLNVQDTLSIVITSVSGTANVGAAISWKELI